MYIFVLMFPGIWSEDFSLVITISCQLQQYLFSIRSTLPLEMRLPPNATQKECQQEIEASKGYCT